MYAVVETGGKQEKVSVGDVFRTELLDAPVGEIVGQDRSKKITVFKRKRKNNYMRKNGHRQFYTSLKVNEIVG